jgi:hypothetical protein
MDVHHSIEIQEERLHGLSGVQENCFVATIESAGFASALSPKGYSASRFIARPNRL